MPNPRKPARIQGHRLVFRNARVTDAEFILGLRTDASKGRYLSATSPDVHAQADWLKRYQSDDSQVYFVIETREGESVGTVRLYDFVHDSFCWGSWILKEGAPHGCAVESALMVYRFARSIGFAKAHFSVRKANQSVWKFHERCGARRIGELEEDYLYEIDAEEIAAMEARFQKYLPSHIRILEDALLEAPESAERRHAS